MKKMKTYFLPAICLLAIVSCSSSDETQNMTDTISSTIWTPQVSTQDHDKIEDLIRFEKNGEYSESISFTAKDGEQSAFIMHGNWKWINDCKIVITHSAATFNGVREEHAEPFETTFTLTTLSNSLLTGVVRDPNYKGGTVLYADETVRYVAVN
jgi:hypothetical protein